MANPAELLLRQLQSWRTDHKNSTVDHAEQRLAVRHLDAIDELLAQMDAAGLKTTLYRKYTGIWAGLVLHHPHEWRAGTTTSHVDEAALENLEHLADRLDGIAPHVTAGGLDSLRDYVDGAAALLDEDESIDPGLKLHVRQVIAHLNWCIANYDIVGDFELQEAVERLIATMLRTAATIKDDEQRGKWKAWMNGFVWPFVVNVAAAIPSSALAQLALGG